MSVANIGIFLFSLNNIIVLLLQLLIIFKLIFKFPVQLNSSANKIALF